MAARRMALMRVEYPLPYPFNHARTSRSSRTATNSFDFGRNADASCSSVSGGMSEKSISDSGAAASRSSDPRWRFVSGLLKIDSDFALTSLSNRDDADEFFAIFCLPIDVSHDQQGLSAGQPQGVPAPLAIVVGSVLNEHQVWIREHAGGGSKIDAVLRSVDPILRRVLFKPHARYTNCITAYRRGLVSSVTRKVRNP
jgi:hypothetical protein